METTPQNGTVLSSPGGASLSIGRPKADYVNVFCSFNPMKKLRFIQSLNNSGTLNITAIHDYENGTGGIAIRMKSAFENVMQSISSTFQTEIP